MKHEEKIQNKLINGTLIRDITTSETHISIHDDITEEEQIERILKNEVKRNSKFNKNIDVNFILEEAISYLSGDISDWIDTAKSKEQKEFTLPIDKDDYGLLGTSFKLNTKTNQIKEYEADILCFVLERDYNPYLERMDDELGFHIVTAYPKTDTPEATPTKRNLQPIAMQTETFKNATPIQKAYFAYQTDQSLATNCHVIYKGSVGNDMIQIQIPYNRCCKVVNCRDHTQKTTITTYNDKQQRIERPKEFSEELLSMRTLFPTETKLANKIMSYIRQFEGLPSLVQQAKESITSSENTNPTKSKSKNDDQLDTP